MSLLQVIGLAFPFLVVFATVPVATALAVRLGAIVHLRSDRLSDRVVPTLGGLAIAVGCLAGLVFVPLPVIDRLALALGIVAMAGLGLADDLRSVSPIKRVLSEMLAGIAFVYFVTGSMDPALRVAAISVSVMAFPIAMNATNLVDNADGLAASLSVVTALTLAGVASLVGLGATTSQLALVIAASCCGFLVHNRPPARIFMGDSGSLMLGFILAACSVLVVREALASGTDAHLAAAVIVPLAWSLQVGDLGMVFVTRRRRGVSPFRGGVDHTSHRLLGAGMGTKAMLLLLSFFAASLSLIATISAVVLGDYRLVALVGLLIGLLVGGFEALVATRLPFPERVGRDVEREMPADVKPGAVGSFPNSVSASGSEVPD